MTKLSNGSSRNSKNIFKRKRIIGGARRNRSTRKPRPPRAPFLIDPVQLDCAHPPESNDTMFAGLGNCDTNEEIDTIHSKRAVKFNKKALRALGKKVSAENRAIVEALLLNPCAAKVPLLTNEQVCREAYTILGASMARIVAENLEWEVGLVTLISGDDATSHDRTVLNISASQKRMQSTLRAMSREFHFGIYELALFNSHRHPDGGRLLQGHGHAFIAGPPGTLAKAQQVAKRHAGKYSPNVSGAHAIDVKQVETTPINLMRVAAYLFKQPYKCLTWNPGKDGKPGHMSGSEKNDRYIRYLRMVQIRSMLPFEDVMFAGGEGVRIRSEIKDTARIVSNRATPGAAPVLHPDAIASFWVDLMPQIRAKRWNLPIIKNRR